MRAEEAEDTKPVSGVARAKGPVPPQFQPNFRTPEQKDRLLRADQAAWSALARFRFASAAAIRQLCYSDLGFELGEFAFKGRVQRHVAKGYWVTHRLGARPDTVVSLTRRGAELYEATYETSPPAWNVDSARRGWLRSNAWAAMTKAGWALQPSVDYLKTLAVAPQLEQLKQKGREASASPGLLDLAQLVERVARGEPVVAPFDYCRGPHKARAWLFVEEPHKSIEAQMDTLKVFLGGLTTMTKDVIYRPVDELSAWSPSRKEWARRSGRLAKALATMKDAGMNVLVREDVPHMQLQE